MLLNPAYAFDSDRTFSGPVSAHVDRVIDGDTFEASAAIWLGQQLKVRVRIAGIDAPELRARCDSERSRAEAARAYLAKRIEGGEVKLMDVHDDKYGGRVDARVADARGDIAAQMILPEWRASTTAVIATGGASPSARRPASYGRTDR